MTAQATTPSRGVVPFLALYGPLTLAVMAAFHLLGRSLYVPVLSGGALAVVLMLVAIALVRATGLRPPALALALALSCAGDLGYLAGQGADYLYFRQQALASLPASVRTSLDRLEISPGRAVDDMLAARTGARGLSGYLRYRAQAAFGPRTVPGAESRLLLVWVIEYLLVCALAGLGAYTASRQGEPLAGDTSSGDYQSER